MLLVGNILVLVAAFKQDVTKGILSLLLAPYAIYFVFTNWEVCKKGFLLAVGGSVLLIGGMGMIGAVTELEGINP